MGLNVARGWREGDGVPLRRFRGAVLATRLTDGGSTVRQMRAGGQCRHKQHTLETLLAYNVQDVLNLETLVVFAYNQKLRETPFSTSHALPPVRTVPNPFHPHQAVIRKCLGDELMPPPRYDPKFSLDRLARSDRDTASD